MKLFQKDKTPLPLGDPLDEPHQRLLDHASGRAKHEFSLGARWLKESDDTWLINVNGNRCCAVVVENNGAAFKVNTLSNSHPAVLALWDDMAVIESRDAVAKAKRDKRLAEVGAHAAEIETRDKYQTVHEVPGGIRTTKHEPFAPNINPV